MSTLSFTAAVSALLIIATVMVAGQEPKIEIGITDTHAHPGQNVTITCRAENKGENLVALQKPFAQGIKDEGVVFLHNELMAKPLASNRYKLEIIPVGSNVQLYKLSITNTSVEDSGPYRCEIRQTSIMADSEFYVYHPVQELSFNNVSVDHGFSVVVLNESSTMDLDCTAKGSIPAADIKMFMGDVEITDEHTKKITGSEIQCRGEATCIRHETFTKSAVIQDFQVTYKDHNKDLKCVATVPSLPSVQAVFKMHVPFSPKFECDMNQVVGLHTVDYKLSCVVLSNPGNPDFAWEFMWGGEQQKLMNNQKTSDGEIVAGQTPREDGSMEVYIKITKVSMRHFMTFSLTSNNSIGSNQAAIKLAQDNTNAAGINSISTISVLLLVLLRAYL